MKSHPYIVYKKESETLEELLQRMRKEFPEIADKKITYAGRLDPMAEGLMILLVGDDVHHKEEYLGYDKVYEVDVLLGVATDTGDILGKCKATAIPNKDIHERAGKHLTKLTGVHEQPYPLFSSKTVHGLPMWTYARNHTSPIDIPTKSIEIYEISPIDHYHLSGDEVLRIIRKRISALSGDFRQEEILDHWGESIIGDNEYTVMRLRIFASSGAYMRVLAERIGELAGVPALAWRIKRIKVGEFDVNYCTIE